MKLTPKKKKRPMAIKTSPLEAAGRKIDRMLKDNQQYRKKKR